MKPNAFLWISILVHSIALPARLFAEEPHMPFDPSPAPDAYENGNAVYNREGQLRFTWSPPPLADEYVLGSAAVPRAYTSEDFENSIDTCEGFQLISARAELLFNNLGDKTADRENETGCEDAANALKAFKRAQDSLAHGACALYCQLTSVNRRDGKTVPKMVSSEARPYGFTPASACTPVPQNRLRDVMHRERGTRFRFTVIVECTEPEVAPPSDVTELNLEVPISTEVSSELQDAMPLAEEASVTEPLAIEEPMVTEEPQAIEEPVAIEEPAAIEEPISYDYAAIAVSAYETVIDFAVDTYIFMTEVVQDFASEPQSLE